MLRRLSLGLVLLLAGSSIAQAQFTLISSATAGSTAGNTITTGAIDTTGATFIGVCVSDYPLGGGTVLSDSKGNTYTGRTAQSSAATQIRAYYVIPTSVGSGHTFTATGIASFASLAVVAFSGGAAASVYDVENGANATGVNTISTGSVTPSVNGELLMACLSSLVTTTIAIDNGFTLQEQTPYSSGAHIGVALGYFVQGTAGALNPAFSWSGFEESGASIATFKPASGAAPVKTLLLLGVGGWQ